MTKKLSIGLLLIVVLMTGCSKSGEDSITIAEQFGLAYAPVQIMRVQGLIEKRMPDAEVSYEQVGNTAAIREAMIAGHVDIGFGAIPPFLIGYEHGMKWKIASGVSQAPVGLVSLDDGIRSITDLSPSDTIALPQPGSIQHMLLSMAAKEEFGNADALDQSIRTMSHPDGFQALIAGGITAHFTSPPYIFRELASDGAHLVLSGEEAFGEPFTFIVGYATEDFHTNNPELYGAFTESLAESIAFMEENPQDAAEILAGIYELDASVVYDYITAEGMIYSTDILGMEKFGSFMHEEGYLDQPAPESAELIWEQP